MASLRPWTPEDDATLRRLHGSGMALHSIAKAMKRSKDTVAKHAVPLGLDFDRTATAVATEAAKKDAKARRAALELAVLADLEEARKRVGRAESAREFQAVAQGMDALMRSYVNLLRQATDDGGLGEARSIVGAILGAIRGSVEGEPRLNPTAAKTEV
ncbi:hypothetical protein GCM10022239_11610 [Leifsonia bigeumensis]|uniref:Helix-turn-helix domain-containing protein n=1 Tax=Leifsonella bigeumensis TaxID=433643 RepID=A0ABP7FE46_9MICO